MNEGAILSSSFVKGTSSEAELVELPAGAELAGTVYRRHENLAYCKREEGGNTGRSFKQHRNAPLAIIFCRVLATYCENEESSIRTWKSFLKLRITPITNPSTSGT